MKYSALFTFFALVLIGSGSAFAAPTERIGSAVQVVNEVSAAFDEDRRDLSRGDEIHQDEMIEVGPDSIGELEFADETKLALGPGSRLLLDKFVYNGEKSKGDIIVNLVKGAFRFVTGVASKPSYRIQTPGAAITVRGTIFDVFVDQDNTIWLLLLEGGITACNDRATCKDLSRPGRILRVRPDGELDDPVQWASLPGRDIIGFRRAFPFMMKAPSINPNPPLTREAVLRGDRPEKTKPKKKAKPKKQKAKKKKARPKKKAKKKTYKKRAAKPRPKKKKRVVKRKRKRKVRQAKRRSGASDAAAAAIAIGIGIGIGKAIGKKKHRKKKPHYGGGGRHNDYGRY